MNQQSDLELRADREAASGNLQAARGSLEQALATGSVSLELWTKLAAICRGLGDFPAALKAVESGLALSPLDFSALLARAMLLERIGDARASEAFANAVAQLPPGREIPKPLAATVDHARKRALAHQEATEERLLQSLPKGLTAAEEAKLRRLASNTSRRTRHYHQEPTNFHFPGLPEIEFHDTAQFGLTEIDAATDAIRAEYEALARLKTAELVPYAQYPDHVPLAQWKELNNSRDWTAVHLVQNGVPVEANASHCPTTLGLVSKLAQPAIPGAGPNAMFSLLAPRTHIPPHTGVANVRLVCHLPLIVPANCGFRVGATTREWKVGEAFVFDDTIEHEAWNDSDELRVVLIFDLWAPALDAAERDAVARMIAATGVAFKGN